MRIRFAQHRGGGRYYDIISKINPRFAKFRFRAARGF